jgi:hypothetical protein
LANLLGTSKAAWRYQFSPPDAFHGRDLDPLQADPKKKGTNLDDGFRRAFQNIWSRFVISGDPTLDGASVAGEDEDGLKAAQKGSWTPWGSGQTNDGLLAKLLGGGSKSSNGTHVVNPMLNLNVTDTKPHRPVWAIVDGAAWEDGRAERCALWAALGAVIME